LERLYFEVAHLAKILALTANPIGIYSRSRDVGGVNSKMEIDEWFCN